jgi:SAM-dependent methyltransferase
MDIASYGTIAKYYDSAYSVKTGVNLQDVHFYLDQAQHHRGPILEIACGTGRILIELARMGMEVAGLDLSADMLAILRTKLAAESQAVQQRVRIYEGDMRSFSLGQLFKQIFIPFRPLQHLYTIDDQISALRCAKDHLQPDGWLTFNVFYPDFRALDGAVETEALDAEWSDSDHPERTIRHYFVRHRVNRLQQYFEGEFIFRTYDAGRLMAEEHAPFTMSYYTYPHLLLLFKYCGLEVVEAYGSFDKEPIDICKEMIFVLRPITP